MKKILKNKKVRIIGIVLLIVVEIFVIGAMFVKTVFPKDVEIEKTWPQVEAMEKARGEMYDKMDQKELQKIKEETQKELLNEWEYANEQKEYSY